MVLGSDRSGAVVGRTSAPPYAAGRMETFNSDGNACHSTTMYSYLVDIIDSHTSQDSTVKDKLRRHHANTTLPSAV
jgi:hypothetical protein